MGRLRDADLLLVAAATVAAALAATLDAPALLRIPLGLAATLILPGYAASLALLPRGEIGWVERGALAFCLSAAGIVVLAAILDSVGVGVSDRGLVSGLTGATLAGVLLVRLRRGAASRTFGTRAGGWRDWPQASPRLAGRRGPTALVAAVTAGFVLAAAFATAVANPDARATEFFLAPDGGGVVGSPKRAEPGSRQSIAVGIASHEPSTTEFRIVVASGAGELGDRDGITVPTGSTWTGGVDFAVPTADIRGVRILLFRSGESTPLRTLEVQLGDAASPAR